MREALSRAKTERKKKGEACIAVVRRYHRFKRPSEPAMVVGTGRLRASEGV
jgi:hypothetical protein